MSREALDRTLLLMRQRLKPTVSDDYLLGVLTGTTVVLTADERNLESHAAQTAFVTAAMLMARSGHAVYVVAPNISLVGPQPPLPSRRLVDGLLEVGTDLIPGIEIRPGRPTEPDLAISFGDSAFTGDTGLLLYLNAGRWSGRLSNMNGSPWREQDWPFGALAAAGMAASEAFKASMRKLRDYAGTPIFDEYFAPTSEANLSLTPNSTPIISYLGEFDFVSGGAITNSVLYTLARIPDVIGHARVIENQQGDLSNLNRYMLMLRSHCHLKKADDLASQDLGSLSIAGIDQRYTPQTRGLIEPFSRRVLVGVDHIPSRWLVQEANPEWLGIAATEGFEASVSYHSKGTTCARCLHNADSGSVEEIPTAAFVSLFGGLMLAANFAEYTARNHIPLSRQHTIIQTLRLEAPVTRWPVKMDPHCPLCLTRGREVMPV